MRAVVQRATRGKVTVEGELVGEIGTGIVALVGVRTDDNEVDAEYLANKIANLRIFEDEDGKMNRSLLETGGEALIISQFTLYGDARQGRRPGFIEASRGEHAEGLYNSVCKRLSNIGIRVATGRFGAYMQVELINDGPTTLLLDSRKGF